MSIEDVIRNSIVMLGSCHVLGNESKTFSAALDNLKMVADKLREIVKEGEERECNHHHEQGEGV